MKNLTVTNIPPVIYAWVQEKAKEKGTNMSVTVKNILFAARDADKEKNKENILF